MAVLAYIALDDEGYVTLFEGDGTEEYKTIVVQGRRAASGRAMAEAVEELTRWAEENGFQVIVPAYDLQLDPLHLEISEDEGETIDPQDIGALFEDLDFAGNDHLLPPDPEEDDSDLF